MSDPAPQHHILLDRSHNWLRRHGVSLLTLRILAVNLLAVMILGAGILYLNQYRQQLIDREQESLKVEARIFAAMIAEGAIEEQPNGTLILSQNAGRQMVRRLSETTQSRAQLYDINRFVMADSHMLVGGIGVVEIEPLQPVTPYDARLARILRWLGISREETMVGLPSNLNLSPAVENDIGNALNGSVGGSIWRNLNNGRIVFTMAAPVQRLKQVLGAVMLIRDGSEIDNAMKNVRSGILKLVALSLMITTAMSLYLASSIDQPIRKLARAADLLRRNPGRSHHIPDFSHRYDEIGDLSISLREMTEAIWARMDAVEAFAADVAHELKNPLTSLRSAVETVNRIKDPEKQQRLLAVIHDDVQRMDRLITDISNASRLDAELSRIANEPVDLLHVVSVVRDLYTPHDDGLPDKPPIRVAVTHGTIAKGDLTVRGVESRLVQVLQNVVGNALSFSPADKPVTVNLSTEDGLGIITVGDHGPGIPPGKLETIFDRFYTERPSSEKFGTHSGLGLSISRQIIQAHRGRIYAENRHDPQGNVLGARFIIKLPLIPR